MQFLRTVDEPKPRSELGVERVGVVPQNIKTTAFCWPFWTEGTHDHMATPLDRARHILDVCVTRFRGREEVEDRAIMPEIVRSWS